MRELNEQILKNQSLSIKCFRHTIVRLRTYKSIFMKLFKTTDIEIVKYCQNIFRFLITKCSVKQIKNAIFSLVRFG